MAPVRQTHPHPIWDLDEYLGRFFEKLGVDPVLSGFFDLMPEVDLEKIRRVGDDVWGTDYEKPGAVAGALNKVATETPQVAGKVGEGWDGEAFEKFKERLELDQGFFEAARNIAQNVGQALVDFADAADASLADGLSVLIGVGGAIVGAIVGFVLGWVGGPPGALVGTILGALVGLAIGVAFTYFGVLLPKVVTAFQALNDLADQLPPDYAA